MVPDRSESTMLPQQPRKRRAGRRLVSKTLCGVFALIGLLPILLSLVLKSPWLRAWAVTETTELLQKQGISAHYDVNISLLPLSVTLQNLKVDSKNSSEPAFESERVSVRPKIFGLLAGQIRVDEVDVRAPVVRLAIADGRIDNLGIE